MLILPVTGIYMCNLSPTRTNILMQEKCRPVEWKTKKLRVITGFRRDVDENCALLGYYVPLLAA